MTIIHYTARTLQIGHFLSTAALKVFPGGCKLCAR